MTPTQRDTPAVPTSATYGDEGRQSCPICQDSVLLNNGGTLRKHRRFEPGGIYQHPRWVVCEGSGGNPDKSQLDEDGRLGVYP